jgi:hypothetical protein
LITTSDLVMRAIQDPVDARGARPAHRDLRGP